MSEQFSETMMNFIAALAIAETALSSIQKKEPNSDAAKIASEALAKINRCVPRSIKTKPQT